MFDFRRHRQLSRVTFGLLALFASALTPGCGDEEEKSSTGGDGRCTYSADCMTPEAAWQGYYAYERGLAAAAGAAGASNEPVGEAGAASYPDYCPQHNGVGPQVFSPDDGSSTASCCYDQADSDSCQ